MVYFIGGDEGGGFLTDFFSFTQRTLKTETSALVLIRSW